MKKLSSSQVLGCGFSAILAILAYSTLEAGYLQRAGGEEQRLAYRRFIQQDDAITAIRRTVWLGGISARDFFLGRSRVGRQKFSAQLRELEVAGQKSLDILRASSPEVLQRLKIESEYAEFIRELRQLEADEPGSIPSPAVFIEEVLAPRRLSLLGTCEDFRAAIRQDLVQAQSQFASARAAAAQKLFILVGAAFLIGLLVAVVTIRFGMRIERERQSHYNAIDLAKLELENLSARLLEIQEQERRTLSRELHDEVGQSLTAIRMELSQSIPLLPHSDVRDRLLRARQLVEATTRTVRDISLMLRPSLLDDLGLGPALQWQLEQFSSRSGVIYTLDGADLGERLPDDIKTCIFRIAQETLNNCEKYSNATFAHVVLRHESGRVSLEIADNGRGFQLDSRGLPPHGTGILGMKERAHKLGGVLSVESAPGRGTRVSLVMPAPADFVTAVGEFA